MFKKFKQVGRQVLVILKQEFIWYVMTKKVRNEQLGKGFINDNFDFLDIF